LAALLGTVCPTSDMFATRAAPMRDRRDRSCRWSVLRQAVPERLTRLAAQVRQERDATVQPDFDHAAP
jgi:hypothetical protein